MANNSVSHEYLSHKLAPLVRSVNDILPVSGNVAITAFDVPHAYYTFDVTATSAPPALPRARSWRVTFVDTEVGLSYDYDYRRYFYLSAEDAAVNDPANAVSAWVIDGKHMFFEYFEGGAAPRIVDLTDASGKPLLFDYRPISATGVSWFFGARLGTSSFPETDNARSILDIDVEA